ncbi:unnamed protein product [Gordionus sp. m RMFG-2023]
MKFMIRFILYLINIIALISCQMVPMEMQLRPNLICNLPKAPGPCRAHFTRWYYNRNTRKCMRFIYGGCQGNANNFKTLMDCRRRCHRSIH